MARCFLIVAVALLALQGSHASLLSDVLVHVANVTKSAITDAEGEVENLKKNVLDQADAEVTKIRGDVEKVVADVQSKIAAVVQKLEDAGKVLVECPLKVPEALVTLGKTLTEKAVSCVTTPVEEAKNITKDLVVEIQLLNNTIEGLQGQLTACQSNFLTAIPCQLKAGYDALSTVAKAASKVTGDVTEGVGLVTGFTTGISTCEAGVFASVPLVTESLIQGVKACYKD